MLEVFFEFESKFFFIYERDKKCHAHLLQDIGGGGSKIDRVHVNPTYTLLYTHGKF